MGEFPNKIEAEFNTDLTVATFDVNGDHTKIVFFWIGFVIMFLALNRILSLNN